MASSDEVIEALGGCGRYQVSLSLLIHLLCSMACWSLMLPIIIFKTPEFWCVDDTTSSNVSQFWTNNISDQMRRSCVNTNGSKCSKFWFTPDMDTMVNQFDLVCENALIPSLIMSIQLAEVLIGNPLSGQLADLFGRRLPLFIGLLLMTVGHLVAVFSVSWQMFAVVRFFIAVGAGLYLTVQHVVSSEYAPARWRTWIVGFPSWQLHSCLLVLIAWLAHHWNYIHITIMMFGILYMLSILCIPESFRWLLTQNRYDEAQRTLESVAKWNRKQLPEFETLISGLHVGEQAKTNYTFIHLFKSRYLLKVTCLSALNWATLGCVFYGLGFGIQALSGNVYINMLLFIDNGRSRCL